METMQLNETWIHGKYTVNNHSVEINTSLPLLDINGEEVAFFQQDESASKCIAQIYNHWVSNDCSVEDSISWFMNTYLNY